MKFCYKIAIVCVFSMIMSASSNANAEAEPTNFGLSYSGRLIDPVTGIALQGPIDIEVKFFTKINFFWCTHDGLL